MESTGFTIFDIPAYYSTQLNYKIVLLLVEHIIFDLLKFEKNLKTDKTGKLNLYFEELTVEPQVL